MPRENPPSVRGALFVALFTALLVLPPVGHHLIVKSDEARFALLARDMIQRGAWLDAQVEGERYRNKPPLFPWSIALLSKARGGVTETTAQLPSALATIVAAVFTCLLGERLFSRRAGVWAGLILATSASVFAHSQQILPDMFVVAFATAAAYAFWLKVDARGVRPLNSPSPGVRPLASPEPGVRPLDSPGQASEPAVTQGSDPLRAASRQRAGPEETRRLAIVGFYVALALCVFAKGPVGVLPIMMVAVWLLTEYGPRGLVTLWSLPGLAVFVAITLAWLLPFLKSGSQSFGENVLWGDWIMWYVGLPLPRRVWAYLGDAFVGFLPWTPILLPALAWALRGRAKPAIRFALLSFAVPFAVVIFSHSRLPRYLLPVYPGAALLVAWWADAHGAEPTRLGRILGWLSFAGVLVAVAVLPWIPDIKESAILSEPGMVWKALPLLAGAVLIGLVFLRGLTTGRPQLVVYGGVVLMSITLGYGAWLFNGFNDEREDFRTVAAMLRRYAPDEDFRVFTQAKLLPLDFYFGRELPRLVTVAELRDYLGRTPRPTVLIDQQDLKLTPPDVAGDLRVLQTLSIHEQSLYILGCSGTERATGSSRCANVAK